MTASAAVGYELPVHRLPAEIPLESAIDSQATPQLLTSEEANFFSEAVESHRADLFEFAKKLTGNEYDADDLVQETFLKGICSFKQFKDKGDGIRPWLWTIAKSKHVDVTRKRSSDKAAVRDISSEPAISDVYQPRLDSIWEKPDESPETTALNRLYFRQLVDQMTAEATAERIELVRRSIASLFLSEAGYRDYDTSAMLGAPISTLRTGRRRLVKHAIRIVEQEPISA